MLPTTPVQIEVRKPGYFKRRYEFWLHDKQIALLVFNKGWGTSGVLFIGERQWNIRSVGFWKKHLEIIAQQSPYTKQNIEYNWKYRMNVKDSNGNWYLFKRVGVFNCSWRWIDEKGQPYVEMKSKHFSKKLRGNVTLSHPGSEDIYLLMLIGWFQLITYEAQAAVVAAGA